MKFPRIIETMEYFDGRRLYTDGPYAIESADGKIKSIAKGRADGHAAETHFLMPSLAECHCHLFLDGDELDAGKRAEYLKSERGAMLATALANVERYRAAGIRLLRDAGDVHGVNREVRERLRGSDITLLSAGTGIRKRKRYGSFMANEIDGAEDIVPLVRSIAQNADTIKIVLTGIIDFENGVVKGEPQFTAAEARLIVDAAHDLGLKTLAHCSGLDGLRTAVAAGVDSIEHGFFMDGEILAAMAEKGIAWCPTFIPVHFQWRHPEHAGWNTATVGRLDAILANHRARLCQAEDMGVAILAGSDAGSYGVRHADGLLEEISLMAAAGLPIEAVLRTATTAPRNHFGLPSNAIIPGNQADFITMDKQESARFLAPLAAAANARESRAA